ncbi:hypothetical protein GGF31_003005 [Allomyces arbusculus]|nr:hypothetical protein GGF31_003005 [Allomyces arbusculus]
MDGGPVPSLIRTANGSVLGTALSGTVSGLTVPRASNAGTSKNRQSMVMANSMIKVHVHPDAPQSALVSAPVLVILALLFMVALVAFPVLVWYGMLAPAAIAAVLAVGVPLFTSIALSGRFIHRRVAHSLDALVRVLLAVSAVVTPVARRISNWPPISALATLSTQALFFSWFVVLMAADRILRRVFAALSGKHVATQLTYSVVNAADPTFQPAGLFTDDVDDIVDDPAQDPSSASASAALRAQGIPFRPKTAYSLAVAAKLAYEDLPIVEAELEQAGYDMDTFTPIHYNNTCGFVVAKGRTIIVVFRGTRPLNLANVVTDIRHEMVPAAEPNSDAEIGMVHEGFLDALGPVEAHGPGDDETDDDGEPDIDPLSPHMDLTRRRSVHSKRTSTLKRRRQRRSHVSSRRAAVVTISPAPRTIRLELKMHNVAQALISSIRAIWTIMELLASTLTRAVRDPIEPYTTVENREESAYVQAHRGIAACVQKMRLRESLAGVFTAHQRALAQRRRRRANATSDGEATVAPSPRPLPVPVMVDVPPLDDIDEEAEERDLLYAVPPALADPLLAADPTAARRVRGLPLGLASPPSTPSETDWDTALEGVVPDDDDDLDVPEKEEPIRLYICGHSLGGAIAHVFLAKLTECHSSFLEFFDGLYTFGSPRVGDAVFQQFMHAHHSSMFRVVYNKDMVPRVPPIDPYAELPGHLVSLSPLGKMVFRPPGTITRPVNFLAPAGLLSPTVIFQLRNESFLRLVYRLLLPFFVNDHFPCDYVAALQKYAY